MRIAFVFPGQGSQSVGMLSGFADNETVAGVMARADEALGFSLTGLMAPPKRFRSRSIPSLRCSPRRSPSMKRGSPPAAARLK